uniref:Uncharacterized protein n=1 Tax=Thermogemmatispora argillosa TaxID=2045280 RepID=A0A455SZT2_9CHLR|nr:hypothetical protein KTA_12750 [Thermogemmatispora argillosa]
MTTLLTALLNALSQPFLNEGASGVGLFQFGDEVIERHGGLWSFPGPCQGKWSAPLVTSGADHRRGKADSDSHRRGKADSDSGESEYSDNISLNKEKRKGLTRC